MDSGLGYGYEYEIRGSIARLRNLDLVNLDQPIEEVRAYLVAKYQDRFMLHPRLFEMVVGSVFKEFGYQSTVTSYSTDSGIDVILEGSNGETVGVQVKRYRGSIKVEQIRALAGALLLGGFTRGVFVTTSTFQRGAGPTAALAARRGVPIELVDAQRFFDALSLASAPKFNSFGEWAESMGDVVSQTVLTKEVPETVESAIPTDYPLPPPSLFLPDAESASGEAP
jgi:restriction system protein